MGYYIPDDMWESLEDQPVKVQNEVIGAVMRLFFTGSEDVLSGVSKSIFIAFRDRVKKSATNAANRKEAAKETRKETDNETGNETGKETGKESRNETGRNAEGNTESAIKGGGGGRDREKGREDASASSAPPPPFAEVVGYLNERAGTAFKASSKATQRLIRARFAEGYTLEDFRRVIDNKVSSWANDARMRDYLRPETLFSPLKFEAYLNERPRKEASPYATAF